MRRWNTVKFAKSLSLHWLYTSIKCVTTVLPIYFTASLMGCVCHLEARQGGFPKTHGGKKWAGFRKRSVSGNCLVGNLFLFCLWYYLPVHKKEHPGGFWSHTERQYRKICSANGCPCSEWVCKREWLLHDIGLTASYLWFDKMKYVVFAFAKKSNRFVIVSPTKALLDARQPLQGPGRVNPKAWQRAEAMDFPLYESWDVPISDHPHH